LGIIFAIGRDWDKFMRDTIAIGINSEPLMCRKFTHIFTTNFVSSLNIRASREVFPIGVRSPEIEMWLSFEKA
jgi:hypothetical protein